MKKFWSDDGAFANDVLLTGITLGGLAVLVWAAPSLYASPRGRFPATMIGLMRSRAVLFNPGITGYYEQLLNGDSQFAPMNDRTFRILATLVQDRIYERTFRFYRFRPNLRGLVVGAQPQGLTTNSFGLLGPECSIDRPPNTHRIALMGDSLSQGWGADQKTSYGRLLEKKINSAGGAHRVELLNFAVTGYSLTQTFDAAEEDVPRFKPDVYFLALTELEVGRTWDDHLLSVIEWEIDPKYDFLREIFRKSGVAPNDDPLVILGKLAPYRMTILRTILSEMKSLASRQHVPFVVALVPSLEDGHMSEKRMDEMPALLTTLGIPFVDLRDTFDTFLDREPLRIGPFDVHPNSRAHAMIADNLYAKLRQMPDLWNAVAGAEANPAGE